MATQTHSVKVGRSTGTNLQAFDDLPADVAALASVAAPIVLQQFKYARGQATTASAADTIVTGLATVVAVIAILEDDPVLTMDRVTAQVGNQAGAPAAGSIVLKSWMPTSVSNPTPIAATTFSKKVNWLAIGT